MREFTYKLVETEEELKGAFEVKRQVFVEEQGIPENLVFDDPGGQALYVIAKDGKRVVGTARIQFLGAKQAKLERMAVLKPFRSIGIGKGIMSFIAEELKGKRVEKVVLHAQQGAVDFYKGCGFKELGSPFWEAGIRHTKMEGAL
jgi:predicted GNAT family N-acyltransferase